MHTFVVGKAVMVANADIIKQLKCDLRQTNIVAMALRDHYCDDDGNGTGQVLLKVCSELGEQKGTNEGTINKMEIRSIKRKMYCVCFGRMHYCDELLSLRTCFESR